MTPKYVYNVCQEVIYMQESWQEVLDTIKDLECEPWKGRADWQRVGSYLGISAAAAKNRYQRLCRWLAENNEVLGNSTHTLSDLLNTVGDKGWEVSTISVGN